MEQDKGKRNLLWVLFIINGIAGIVWVTASLDSTETGSGINFLYLAIGALNLIASILWFWNARKS